MRYSPPASIVRVLFVSPLSVESRTLLIFPPSTRTSLLSVSLPVRVSTTATLCSKSGAKAPLEVSDVVIFENLSSSRRKLATIELVRHSTVGRASPSYPSSPRCASVLRGNSGGWLTKMGVQRIDNALAPLRQRRRKKRLTKLFTEEQCLSAGTSVYSVHRCGDSPQSANPHDTGQEPLLPCSSTPALPLAAY